MQIIHTSSVQRVDTISDSRVKMTLETLKKWETMALAGCSADHSSLFSPQSTFVGTMANRAVAVNVDGEPDYLKRYMEGFLPGLQAIAWHEVLITQSEMGTLATGTYTFSKVGAERTGHFTFIVDGNGKIKHHHSGIKIEGTSSIEI